MTLQDAHKTGRKYRREGEHIWGRHKMRHSISVDSAIADDWEVEPEVYEVECEWRVDGSGNCAPWCLDGNYIPKIEGKRTKLTIEVLD